MYKANKGVVVVVVVVLHVTSVMTSSFAMASQALYIAMYSGEYEKVLPTNFFFRSC